MKQLKLIFLFIFLCGFCYGQKSITGKIVDNNSNPLPGANIIIKGTTNGTASDFNGNFEIEAPDNAILVISMVGFDTKETPTNSASNYIITLEEGLSLDEIVIVGSRNPNRTAVDTPVPVDVIDITEITKASPQVNVNSILNYVAPSFTANTQNISDGTDHIEPASLRGLGPDQVLVLINGKRRHNSSLVNVNGTFGRGSVGTDLNAIPSAAIKRVEILRDGAAAQYGSDAIAGVINIVLNTSVNELSFNVTSGANFSRNAEEQTGGVDGETVNISANYGIPIGDNGGYINLTGDFDYRDDFSRMRQFEGNIFNLYNTVERVANENGADLFNLLDDDVTDVIQFANEAGIDIGTATTKEDLQSILSADNTEAELAARGLDRTDFNLRVGQSRVRSGRFFANLSIPLENETEIYSFAGISSRTGNSAGFFRLPNQARTFTPTFINGFLPEINSTITDKSFAAGIRGKINDWNVDLSNTWGENTFLYVISNTSNASLQNASPNTFDAGGFAFTQNTVNLDINKFHESVFEGLNVAFGAEYRLENYEIFAGEEASFGQFTAEGELITIASQEPAQDFFGNSRDGGSQVFPGFRPDNELSRNRNSLGLYFDLEADFTDKFLASFATRFENYSDFGSTINFKLAGRYKVTDNLNIRSAASTGFRAPSLQQLNFNSVSTIFVDGEPQEVGTFSNDSRVAGLLGIPQLEEEKSQSISLGITAKIPDANLSITVDGYFIGIDDRVVLTGTFDPQLDEVTGLPIDEANEELASLLGQAGASGAAFFANAIDTESVGLDIVITHKANLGNGKLKSDLSGTFSRTRRVGNINSSQVLRDAGLESTFFDEMSRVFLEESVPRTKFNLTNNYSVENWNFFLRNVIFGPVSEATNTVANQQEFDSKLVTDLSVGYQFTEALNITLGANNLFDIFPDRAIEENRSSGRFDFSRRSQQFGISGRFLFARLSFILK